MSSASYPSYNPGNPPPDDIVAVPVDAMISLRVNEGVSVAAVEPGASKSHSDVQDHPPPRTMSNSSLRDLVSNEFGLALLAPLAVDHLWEADRSELFLEEGKLTDSHDHSLLLDSKRASSSVSMATVTTQEPDSSLDEHASVLIAGDQVVDEDFPERVQVIPEPMDDLQFCPRILTPDMMQQIHSQLPETLQLYKWDRCFAIGRDGDSFVTLLEACKSFQYSVVVIKTLQGHVLGGFATQPWNQNRERKNSYFGTGQSFLFASQPDQSMLPGDARAVTSTSHRLAGMGIIPEGEVDLSFYRWTGTNDYCQICNVDKRVLCMGGEGNFGWIVQDNFERGQSGRCRTYSNPPLVPPETCFGGNFDIADFEIYGLKPLFADSASAMTVSRSLLSVGQT